MDYNALRESAKKFRTIDVDPKKFIAAILYHYVNPENIGGDCDFIWIKAHKKIQTSQVKASYMSRDFDDAGVAPPSDVHIVFENEIANPTATLGELNHYNDGLIIFRAIDVDSPEGIALSRSDPTATTNPREPLQAVNRQSSASAGHWSRNLGMGALKKEGNGDENSIPITQPLTKDPSEIDHRVEVPILPPSDQHYTTYPSPQQHFPHAPNPQGDVGQEHMPLYHHHYCQSGYVKGEDISNPGAPYKVPSSALPPPPYLPPTPVNEMYASAFNPFPTFEDLSGHPLIPHPHLVPPVRMAERPPSLDLPAHDYLAASDSHIDDSGEINLDFMQDLMNETDTVVLEQAVKKGMRIINNVRAPIASLLQENVEAAQLLEQIDSIKSQAKRTRTIVGVVGNTGAGKSSVINALLDEERLVPTNCMRACTAVVTEISWNEDASPSNKYRADIEFISRADWEKELNILFKDLLDESGHVSRDYTNPDTEAGVAYAKIKAVYPQRTKDDIANSSVSGLMSVWGVKNLLGTTKHLKDRNPDRFYRSLQKYVDSTEKEEERDKKKPKRMEYWPLIKCVKIYTRSDALSTGAVIVDLPGVQDSNAARAAVAEGYMKQCSGLWIVAPINRAVNDKAAKKLLGDQFKRQMKYDGMFSNVTFICSKTDDISITEAAPSLGIEDRVQGSWDEIQSLEQERYDAKEKVDELKEQLEWNAQVFADQDALVDVWEKLEYQLEKGKTVYAPVEKTKKRKRKTGKDKPTKKTSWDSDIEEISHDDDPYSNSDTESDLASEDEVSDKVGRPLTAKDIKTKLEQLKSTKKEARKEKGRFKDLIKTKNKEIAEINKKIKGVKAQIASVCISGRNDWSRTRIQEDYAMGIKELDQENAIEEDEANFDPDDELRDYNKIAQSLPVFCVSSRAYQKMSGRLEKDGNVAGFLTMDETEIPQLKNHCKKLTEAGRAGTCRVFLNALSQLLLSLSLWASNGGSEIELTTEQHRVECDILQDRLNILKVDIERAVESSTIAIKNTLAEHIFDHYHVARKAAETMALPTAQKWGGTRDSGGLHFMTYKATCRRDGGPFRDVDFNRQLAEPLEKHLVNGWERCFSMGMPKVLKQFRTDLTQMLKTFHKKIEEHARGRGVGIVGLRILSQKLDTQEAYFGTLTDQLNALISDKQREANRELTPVIGIGMQDAYERCVNERGKGSFGRMKAHMTGHVQNRIVTVFKDATDTVRVSLKDMTSGVESEMTDRTEDVFREVEKDYMNVITGVKLPEGYVMPKTERQMREQVAEAVKGAENVFLGPDVQEPEDEEVGTGAEADDNTSDANDDDIDVSDEHSQGDAEEITEEAVAEVEDDDLLPKLRAADEGRDPGYRVDGDVADSQSAEEDED